MMYRVLWRDEGDTGHFTDVDANSESAAAWKVALAAHIDADSINIGFVDVQEL